MKIRTITNSLLVAVLLAQSAAAFANPSAEPTAATQLQQTTPATQESQAVSSIDLTPESYTELLQRIKEESIRELNETLDTGEIASEILRSTVRSFMATMLSGKPQL